MPEFFFYAMPKSFSCSCQPHGRLVSSLVKSAGIAPDRQSSISLNADLPFFQLLDGIFRQSEGRIRGFPADHDGIRIEKYPLAMYIRMDICAKKQINNIFWKGKRQ